MPSGATASQAWKLLNSATQAASVFGAGLDANASIGAQNGGALYVYQASPASLSLNVDTGFLLHRAGTGFVLQGGGSPVTVTLTIPTVNPQYATIYWDNQANTVGVQYSPVASSPTPLYPESHTQIPLAVVYLVPGMTVIQANSIQDVRQLVVPGGYVFKGIDPFNAAGGSVNCNGATDLEVRLNLGTTGGGQLNLQNFSYGTRTSIIIENSSGANRAVFLLATTPAGVTIGTFYSVRGTGVVNAWNTTTSTSWGTGQTQPLRGYWSKGASQLVLA